MINSKQNNLSSKAMEIFFFIILFIWLYSDRLFLDFWNDELYTLKNFVFTQVSITLTDYHAPNNHVFLNLLNNIYLKIIGVDSLYELMENPFLMRALPLLYFLILLFFIYKLSLEFFNKRTAQLSLLLLFTSIPYYHFAFQIRGYGLSALFLVLIVYYGLRFLKSGKKTLLFLIAILTAFTFYTVLSNLYPLIGLLCFLYAKILWENKEKSSNLLNTFYQLPKNALFQLALSIKIGLLIGLFFYLPIFEEVFFNSVVQTKTNHPFLRLGYNSVYLLQGLISGRWIIAILAIIGYMKNFNNHRNWGCFFGLIFFMTFIPILLSFLRWDRSPIRVFVVMIPLLTILFGIGLDLFWELIRERLVEYKFYFLGLSIIALVNFQMEKSKIMHQIELDIQNNGRSQDLYYQYYSYHYQPLTDIKYFYENIYDRKYPVFIKGCEPHGIKHYLEKYNIKYYFFEDFDSIKIEEKAFIITNHPYHLDSLSEFKITNLSKRNSYHNIISITRK